MPVTITQARKDELVKRAREHKEADRLLQGDYGALDYDPVEGDDNTHHLHPKGPREFAGCAIGCLANPVGLRNPLVSYHDQYDVLEQRFGLPKRLLDLVDGVFEGLSPRKARNWPLQFAEALPVGVRLTDEDVEAGVGFVYGDDPEHTRRAIRRWLVSLS